MAVQSKNSRSTAGRANKTPAPIEDFSAALAKERLIASRAWGRASGNPGANAYDGPSSLPPGAVITAGLNVQTPEGKPDAVLESVIRGGAKPDASQTRDVGTDSGMKPSFQQKRQTGAMGALPSKIGASNSPLPTRAK
jgi:hypothetical protein